MNDTHNRIFSDGRLVRVSREHHVKCRLSLVTTCCTSSLKKASLTYTLYAVKSVSYIMAAIRNSLRKKHIFTMQSDTGYISFSVVGCISLAQTADSSKHCWSRPDSLFVVLAIYHTHRFGVQVETHVSYLYIFDMWVTSTK